MSGPGYQGDIAIDDVSFTPSCRPDSTATISPTVPTPTGTTPPGCKTGQFRYEDINPQCNKLATMLCGLWFCGQLPPDRTGQFIPKVESYVIRRSLVIEQWSSRPTHMVHFRNTLTVDLVFSLNMLSRSGCLFHRILTLVLLGFHLFVRCTNGRNCIDVNKVCNFRSDCTDNSDEANCPTKCDFQTDYCKWKNAQVGDRYDWIRNKGKTPSKFTGPSADHTYNTSAGEW